MVLSTHFFDNFEEYATKIRKRFKIEISDDLIRRGISSVDSLTDIQLLNLYRTQDTYCVRCGNCCRKCHPIAFSKGELKKIAKETGISYKKLKKRLRAYPTVTGVLAVPSKPCPFLEGKNRCSIYDLRPGVCREYPLGDVLQDILLGVRSSTLSEFCPGIDKMMVFSIVAAISRELVIIEFGEEELEKYVESIIPIKVLREIYSLPPGPRLKTLDEFLSRLRSSN